jgi:hypothetical protein
MARDNACEQHAQRARYAGDGERHERTRGLDEGVDESRLGVDGG